MPTIPRHSRFLPAKLIHFQVQQICEWNESDMVFLIDVLFILYSLAMMTSFAMIVCGCKPEKKQNKCPVREVTPSMRMAPLSDVPNDSTRTAMDNKSEMKKKRSAEERGSRKSRKSKKKKRSADASVKVSKKSKKEKKEKKGPSGFKKIFQKIREPETTQPSMNSNERLKKQQRPGPRPVHPGSQPMSNNQVAPLTAKTAPSIPNEPAPAPPGLTPTAPPTPAVPTPQGSPGTQGTQGSTAPQPPTGPPGSQTLPSANPPAPNISPTSPSPAQPSPDGKEATPSLQKTPVQP